MSKTCRDSRASKDFFGTEFKVGDIVACLKPGTSTSWLVYGVVLKLSEKISLIFTDGNREGVGKTIRKYNMGVCQMTEREKLKATIVKWIIKLCWI